MSCLVTTELVSSFRDDLGLSTRKTASQLEDNRDCFATLTCLTLMSAAFCSAMASFSRR